MLWGKGGGGGGAGVWVILSILDIFSLAVLLPGFKKQKKTK